MTPIVQRGATDGAHDLLTAAELAARVGCCVRSLPKYIRDGKLPAPIKLGRLCRWPRPVVDAWLSSAD